MCIYAWISDCLLYFIIVDSDTPIVTSCHKFHTAQAAAVAYLMLFFADLSTVNPFSQSIRQSYPF